MLCHSFFLLVCGLLLLVPDIAAFLADLDVKKSVRKPFRLIWDQASSPCYQQKFNYLFNASDHPEVEINHGMRFYGEKVTTLYSGRFGLWPRVDRTTHSWVNGGLPQYIDMENHLKSTKDWIKRNVPSNPGYSVLDFESWYPPFSTNYVVTRNAQIMDTRKHYPNLTEAEVKIKAAEIWNAASRKVFEQTLLAAIEEKPRRYWGYYHYPKVWSSKVNGEHQWLWNTSSGIYPQLYVLGNLDRKKPEAENQRQIKVLSECFRKRALYGNPDTPIMAFVLLQRVAPQTPPKLTGDWLRMAIEEPIEKGVDGLIIWGSDRFFKPRESECPAWQKYLSDHFLPLAKSLMAKMSRCSGLLCGGNGRCVNKKYADIIPYVITRGVPQPDDSTPSQTTPKSNNNSSSSSSSSKELQSFMDNYVCQCYSGWAGDWCGNEH